MCLGRTHLGVVTLFVLILFFTYSSFVQFIVYYKGKYNLSSDII